MRLALARYPRARPPGGAGHHLAVEVSDRRAGRGPRRREVEGTFAPAMRSPTSTVAASRPHHRATHLSAITLARGTLPAAQIGGYSRATAVPAPSTDACQMEPGCMIIHDRPATGMRAHAAYSARPVGRARTTGGRNGADIVEVPGLRGMAFGPGMPWPTGGEHWPASIKSITLSNASRECARTPSGRSVRPQLRGS